MPLDRRQLILAASLAALGSPGVLIGEERDSGLYQTASSEAILAATRTLIASDMIGTFITLDVTGQPRARSILVSAPDSDLTLWMATRKGSRKLDQIATNRHATLHFADDSRNAYLSLMGEARAVFDPDVIAVKNPYKGNALAKYFPAFPNDFVLISFKPSYLEIATVSLPVKPETWQPQGVRV